MCVKIIYLTECQLQINAYTVNILKHEWESYTLPSGYWFVVAGRGMRLEKENIGNLNLFSEILHFKKRKNLKQRWTTFGY